MKLEAFLEDLKKKIHSHQTIEEKIDFSKADAKLNQVLKSVLDRRMHELDTCVQTLEHFNDTLLALAEDEPWALDIVKDASQIVEEMRRDD